MLQRTVFLIISIGFFLLTPGISPGVLAQVVGIGQTDRDGPPSLKDEPASPTWVRRWDGGANLLDYAAAMTADSAGSVYVTGYSVHPGTSANDFATVKYGGSGTLLWARRYPNSGSYSAESRAIAVRGGNVYVTGRKLVGSSRTLLTVKYDGNGNQLWAKSYMAPDDVDVSAIAVDSLGNAFVGGSSKKYYVTIKYGASGQRLWVRRYGSSGDNNDQGNALAVDATGDVYVTGRLGTFDSNQLVTVKYASTGELLWVRRYRKPGIAGSEGNALKVDTAGNLYVAGFFRPSGGECDYALLKYSATGDLLWVRSYDGPAGRDDRAVALALDSADKVYVTGTSQNASGYRSYATLKYTPAGDVLWSKRYYLGTTVSYYARAMVVDRYANVLVTGHVMGGPNGNDCVTVKYNSDGGLLWHERFNGSANADDFPVGVASSGRAAKAYVVGSSRETGSGLDYFVLKY
jgi:hypothetical protein